MEYISKSSHERTENPSSTSPSNSPTTTTNNGSITSLSSSNVNNQSNNNGVQTPSSKPTTPRSDPNNPYPTTFVQADTSNFKQVVQMLTGSTETIKQTPPRQHQEQRNFNIPPKKQGFKLYERRNCNNNSSNLKNSLMINTLLPNFAANNSGFSPRKPEILSPSLLDFPSLTLSPVTPLNDDAFNKSMSPSPLLAMNNTPSLEEERAIAEKGFYLHPSPRGPAEPPQLLPLFPVTSPRVSGSAAASS